MFPQHARHEACPGCGSTSSALTLLTSMIKYFACRQCGSRWQVSVVHNDVGDMPLAIATPAA
jgi:hypothetical protein